MASLPSVGLLGLVVRGTRDRYDEAEDSPVSRSEHEELELTYANAACLKTGQLSELFRVQLQQLQHSGCTAGRMTRTLLPASHCLDRHRQSLGQQ